MKTITIITDSLAMPRVEGDEKIYIQQTWPKLLAQKLGNEYVFAEFKERARDTDSLNLVQVFNESIVNVRPDLLIIQIGIVDCAPRIISKKEHQILNRFYFPKRLRNLIIQQRKKNKQRILRKGALLKVYVSPETFKNNLDKFIKASLAIRPTLNILLIPILGDLEKLDSISSGYYSNIQKYNKILSELENGNNIIVPENWMNEMNSSENYCTDGYHLNEMGHLKLSQKIVNLISKT